MNDIGIIIPTFDNPQYLVPCIQSILRETANQNYHIYIVNNGEPQHMAYFKKEEQVTILQQDRNLGWEGGLIKGLEASKEPYVVFLNDDTFIVPHQKNWLDDMLKHFEDDATGAVGPSSNVVMGSQNIFVGMSERCLITRYLIGFCMMLKRDVLDAVGGVDGALPGGDDLDLSIRLRQAGKKLICDRNVFVWHHGFKTGERVEGGPNQGGWNSIEKIERTNFALINKHGLKPFLALFDESMAYA